MPADLRERVEELEAENRYLREMLAPSDLLPRHWGLTAHQTRLVVAIARAPGFLSKERIRMALGHVDRDVTDKVVEVQLCLARKRLTPVGVAILTERGLGLTMSPESRAIIREALAAVRAGTVL